MSNKRKIRPFEGLSLEAATFDHEKEFTVPLTTELIDGTKRIVGEGLVTREKDGSYSMTTRIFDPEAIAMIQDPDPQVSLRINEL